MENSKATHPIDNASILNIFWEGDVEIQDLPADADRVEVEAPCPAGYSWKIRRATEEDIADGKTEGTLICFLSRVEKGANMLFLTSGLNMIIRLPAGSAIALEKR